MRIQSPSDREDDPDLRPLWGDYWVKSELIQALEALGVEVVDRAPDVFLHLFGGPPKKPPPTSSINLLWVYSHPDRVTAEDLNPFDHVFCASRPFIRKLIGPGRPPVTFMPACTAKKPVETPRLRDVVFLGNARTSRKDGRAAVRDLMAAGLPFQVWGNGWENIVPPENHGGRYWPYDRIDSLYASARIVLTDHHRDMAREGFVSNKVFDILASGGLAVCQRNAGLADLFGSAVPQYRSVPELKRLVTYYLERDAERERLAWQGRSVALRHTYRARAQRMVDVAARIGAGGSARLE
jgi:hypothetical protein